LRKSSAKWQRSTRERKSVEDGCLARCVRAEEREALKARIARQGDLAWQLARLETEWLEISEALERMDAGAA
jgi:hypothetical protein